MKNMMMGLNSVMPMGSFEPSRVPIGKGTDAERKARDAAERKKKWGKKRMPADDFYVERDSMM